MYWNLQARNIDSSVGDSDKFASLTTALVVRTNLYQGTCMFTG